MTVFLAQDLQPVSAHLDPDELIHPVVLSVRSALRSIRTGRLRDAKSIIGVLFALEALTPGARSGTRSLPRHQLALRTRITATHARLDTD